MLPHSPKHESGSCTTTVTQTPSWQLVPGAHEPHEPPHASAPQAAKWHRSGSGSHAETHFPSWQMFELASEHVPHNPPQPSSPQTRASPQLGVQAQVASDLQVALRPAHPRTGRPAIAQSGSTAPQPQSHASRAP